jgi:hypothetical protein
VPERATGVSRIHLGHDALANISADVLGESPHLGATLARRRWRLVSSPDPGFDNVLSGTATAGPSTVWAVGGFTNRLTLAENTLTLENTHG